MNFSQAIQQSRLAVIRDAIDNGTSGGKLKIYDGTKPAIGATITDQVLLVVFTFSAVCGTIDYNNLTFSFVENEVLCSDTGIATWARFTDSSDSFCADTTVSDEHGTGVIKLDNTNLYEGGICRILNAVLSEP